MPLIAVSLVVFLAIVGISIDVMRDVETAHQLSYAAKSAALYGLSLATNSNGSFTQGSGQANITNAITSVGTTAGSFGVRFEKISSFRRSLIAFLYD